MSDNLKQAVREGKNECTKYFNKAFDELISEYKVGLVKTNPVQKPQPLITFSVALLMNEAVLQIMGNLSEDDQKDIFDKYHTRATSILGTL